MLYLFSLLLHLLCTSASAIAVPPPPRSSTTSSLLANYRVSDDDFLIRGWRWHTLSLLHETQRLQCACPRLQQGDLQTATQYVVDFNLHGLGEIETNVLDPWLLEHCPEVDVSILQQQRQELMEWGARVQDQVVSY